MASVTYSANSNSFSSPGILSKENFADFLETNFQKVNEDLMKQAVQGLQFCVVVTALQKSVFV